MTLESITTNKVKKETVSGNKALQIDEPLLFDLGSLSECKRHYGGVDLPKIGNRRSDKLGGLKKESPLNLPNLSEPQVVRHFTRLSQKNYSIDTGMFPLGSCTMKHNPRLNEKVARLSGFSSCHPLQPEKTVQGSLKVMEELGFWLCELTGLKSVALSPAAGAHGELCGIMAIRSALEHRKDKRKRVLIPESAHGTNPATAVTCGYEVDTIPANSRGRTDLKILKEKLGDDVAAIMLTNPNTCGLFEDEIIEISELIHERGAYFYCDGANFNAIVGKVRPVDLGIDVMHINLHKTFSTPHGGGGPGSGPVVLSEALTPFAPLPCIYFDRNGLKIVEESNSSYGTENSLGRLKAFHGQMGMFVRALAYMMSHGKDGLKQVSEDAVLNANYILANLKNHLSLSYDGPCMHEVLFDDRFLKETGVSTLDFAKALIDEGYHPMTMYFPLVVSGALLIEPTETESKFSLDQFIQIMKELATKAKDKNTDFFKQSPTFAPVQRVDETLAARKPVLRWTPNNQNQDVFKKAIGE